MTDSTPAPARRFVLALCCLLLLNEVWARPRQQPPALALRKPPNVIVRATLTGLDAGQLHLRVHETVFGEPAPVQVSVQAPTTLTAGLVVGRSYLAVYNNARRDPMRPKRQMQHPGGPRLVYEAGAEPALFADTPLMRELLGSDSACILGLDRSGRRRLFAGLRGDEPAVQQFLAADLFMCPDLRADLSRRERRFVLDRLSDAKSHPLARAWLLRVVLADATGFRHQGLALANTILHSTDVAVGDSQQAELVRMTFVELETAGLEPSLDASERWLYSDSPALAELALLALRRQSPERERAALVRALAADARVPARTQGFLVDHVRRLEASGAD